MLGSNFSSIFLLFAEAGISAFRKPCGKRDAFCACEPTQTINAKMVSKDFFILNFSFRLEIILSGIDRPKLSKLLLGKNEYLEFDATMTF